MASNSPAGRAYRTNRIRDQDRPHGQEYKKTIIRQQYSHPVALLTMSTPVYYLEDKQVYGKDVLTRSWKGMGDDLARSVGLFEPPLARNQDLAPKQDEEVEREVHLRSNPAYICVDNGSAY